MKERERRLNDPEYMADLRQWFYIRNPHMTDDEVYDLCGNTLNAALCEWALAMRRLRRAMRTTLPYRGLVAIIASINRAVRWAVRKIDA